MQGIAFLTCFSCSFSLPFACLPKPCLSCYDACAAILDEICEHRIYEAARLRALFRSYSSLNAGEAFFPILNTVIGELRVELGVE